MVSESTTTAEPNSSTTEVPATVYYSFWVLFGMSVTFLVLFFYILLVTLMRSNAESATLLREGKAFSSWIKPKIMDREDKMAAEFDDSFQQVSRMLLPMQGFKDLGGGSSATVRGEEMVLQPRADHPFCRTNINAREDNIQLTLTNRITHGPLLYLGMKDKILNKADVMDAKGEIPSNAIDAEVTKARENWNETFSIDSDVAVSIPLDPVDNNVSRFPLFETIMTDRTNTILEDVDERPSFFLSRDSSEHPELDAGSSGDSQ